MKTLEEQVTKSEMNYFYIELQEGNVIVTEVPTSEHSWLLKHDYKNCSNSNLPKEYHKKKWLTYIKNEHFESRTENGKMMLNYFSLNTYITGIYKYLNCLILSTQCNRRYSFYLIDEKVPGTIRDYLADDKYTQRYINENTEQIYSMFPSKVASLKAHGKLPIHSYLDSTYEYHIYALTALHDESLLYLVEVACHCGRRSYIAFRNENIARRFIEDFTKGPFQFCTNPSTK